MSNLSLNETAAPERDTLSKAATAESLVASLRQTEFALREGIKAEEERTSLRDQSDPCYSILARSMRARAENLKMTIALLMAGQHAA